MQGHLGKAMLGTSCLDTGWPPHPASIALVPGTGVASLALTNLSESPRLCTQVLKKLISNTGTISQTTKMFTLFALALDLCAHPFSKNDPVHPSALLVPLAQLQKQKRKHGLYPPYNGPTLLPVPGCWCSFDLPSPPSPPRLCLLDFRG